jgi:hypothetical protein
MAFHARVLVACEECTEADRLALAEIEAEARTRLLPAEKRWSPYPIGRV